MPGPLGRILGLDVGDRRIGVALSDSLGFSAQRLLTLERKNMRADVQAIRRLVKEHEVRCIVVGLPLTLRGERGVQAQRVEGFAQTLRQKLEVAVEFVDERLTTVEGERALLETHTSRRKRRQVIDQVAAQLILQQYLDGHRSP